MAQRSKVHPDRDAIDSELRKHIHALGLAGVQEYRAWCARHGFSVRLNKHWKRRCRERFYARQAVAETRLVQKKREKKNGANVLAAVCRCELEEADVTQPYLRLLCQAVKDIEGRGSEKAANRTALAEMVAHVHAARAGLFTHRPVVAALGRAVGNTFVEALAAVAAEHRGWLRPLVQWRPRTHNARRQFASLLRHLFVRHEMPAFFDSAWFLGRGPEAARQRRWYRHVGLGHSIRRCDLPIPYSKRMVHWFLRAPADLTVPAALRWGQVIALGGDARLARAVLATRLGASFEHDEFWSTVLRWLVEHPELPADQVAPVVDFVQHQRFALEPVFTAPGRREELPPPQPNLTMNGRTVASLLRQVRAWHRRLAAEGAPQSGEWSKSGFDDFEFAEGFEQSGNLRYWTIRELLNAKALYHEGRKLKHCVGSYASACARRECSIWTLELDSFEGRTKLLTIEVRPEQRIVIQARGKANRRATPQERAILRRWACQANLTVAHHV